MSDPEPTGFSGTCQNASLPDWIQLVQMGRRDAVIGVRTHDGRKGMLWCHDGDIVDAFCDGLLGEDAVYLALSWEGGQVSVAFVACERPRRIHIATGALLLRAAYRRDSGVRELGTTQRTSSSVSSAPPALSAQPVAAAPSAPPSAPSSAPSRAPVESTAPSASSLAPLPDGRARRRLAALAGVAMVAATALALAVARSSAPSAAQPARDERGPGAPALVATPKPASPSPDIAPAPPAPAQPAASKVEGKSAALPGWRAPSRSHAVVLPTRDTALPKPSPKAVPARAGPKIEEPAPRVQIIDERESQIEVIQ